MSEPFCSKCKDTGEVLDRRTRSGKKPCPYCTGKAPLCASCDGAGRLTESKGGVSVGVPCPDCGATGVVDVLPHPLDSFARPKTVETEISGVVMEGDWGCPVCRAHNRKEDDHCWRCENMDRYTPQVAPPRPNAEECRKILADRTAWLERPDPQGCGGDMRAFPHGRVDAALVWAWKRLQELESYGRSSEVWVSVDLTEETRAKVLEILEAAPPGEWRIRTQGGPT